MEPQQPPMPGSLSAAPTAEEAASATAVPKEIPNTEVRTTEATTTAARTSSPGVSELDSEELEQMEAAAEAELSDEEADDVQDRFFEEVDLLFPEEEVQDMVAFLKENGMVRFLQVYAEKYRGKIKHLMASLGVLLPRQLILQDLEDRDLYPMLKTAISRILRNRSKLAQYNTFDDALSLIASSKHIVVLSGAGISVSCGIPDFRSRDGIYAQLQRDPEFCDMDDPTDMFDKEVFLRNPRLFYSFAHRIFPSNFRPSPSHRFIKLLEEQGKLLRNYSQNIDTLEQLAGIEKVLQCHGSFATATCTDPACAYRTNGSDIKDAIFRKEVPDCPACVERKRKRKAAGGRAKSSKKVKSNGEGGRGRSTPKFKDEDSEDEDDDGKAYGIMKPDITFFGEKLSNTFDRALLEDRDKVDLLIVMGTSLKVAPVSELVSHIPHSTPVILINQSPVYHIATDIMLLGEADGIVDRICSRLGWPLPEPKPVKAVVGDVELPASNVAQDGDEEDHGETAARAVGDEPEEGEPSRLMDSHVWLFRGADVGRLPELLGAEDSGDNEPDDEDAAGTDEEDGGRQVEAPTIVGEGIEK